MIDDHQSPLERTSQATAEFQNKVEVSVKKLNDLAFEQCIDQMKNPGTLGTEYGKLLPNLTMQSASNQTKLAIFHALCGIRLELTALREDIQKRQSKEKLDV